MSSSKIKLIKINVSNLYVLLGHNYFNNFDKVLQNAWRTFDSKGYKEFIALAESEQNIVSATHRPEEQIKRLQEKLKINISSQTYLAKKSNNSKELAQNQQKIITQISRTHTTDAKQQEAKKRLQTLVTNTTNAGYGTFQEGSVYKQIENHLNTKVISNQQKLVYSIPLTSDNNTISDIKVEWQLIGKIDGLTSDNDLIEIKNRTKKLFKELRKYEEPQIMTYLHLFDKSKGYLVEQLKTKDQIQINYVPVSYDENYFENKVLPSVYKFINYFAVFMQNEEMKKALILGDEKFLYNLFINS